MLGTKALLKALLVALSVAAVALLTVILPAEYNIDPTGIGERLGLTALSATQVVEVQDELESVVVAPEPLESTDSIDIIVPAHSGVEFKFNMDQFQKLSYNWKTDGTVLYFDLHGEPEGDTTGYFESYAIAELSGMEGSFTAPFTGSHGWYWKNISDQPVVVVLHVEGEYTIKGLRK